MITMTELIRHPMTIALWLSIVTIGVPLLTYYLNKKSNGAEALQKLLDGKVNNKDCTPAMKRVGCAIDGCEEDIKSDKRAITKIQKGMIWLVKDHKGDPAALGLMD